MRLLSIMTAGFGLVAGNVAACEPPIMPEVDFPVEVAPDGSFIRAEDNDYDALHGGPASDIGNGLTAQTIYHTAFCDHTETLVLTDCGSAEMIGIVGVPDAEGGSGMMGGPFLVDLVLAPRGAIDLDRLTSLDEARKIASDAGYTVEENFERAFNWLAPQNRFDLFIGCKLHYPASRGAA